MADDDPKVLNDQLLQERIDLLLDDEAGAEGPRWLGEIEDDPEAKVQYDFARSVDLALRNALADEDPPDSLWANLEARLETEPLPAATWVDWIQGAARGLVQITGRQKALAGSTFLFLLTCGTLWWDGSGGYMPPPRRDLSWRSPTMSLERSLSDQLEREAERALEDLIYEHNYLRSLEGSAPPEGGTTSEGGAP